MAPSTAARKRLGPREDATPHIRPAGLAHLNDGQDAGSYMHFGGPFTHEIPKNRMPPTQSAHIPGKVPSNISSVSSIAKPMTHGDKSGPGSAVNTPTILELPRRAVHPLMRELVQRRETIYKREENQALGQTISRHPLPASITSSTRPFGVQTKFEGNAGSLISPSPPKHEPTPAEEDDVHRLYVRSHGSYRPGEQCDRGYKFEKNRIWGIPSGTDTLGGKVSEVMRWHAGGGKLESKRFRDFMDRNRPKLGEVFDPLEDTMDVPADHTFGYRAKPNEYGVVELLRGGDRSQTFADDENDSSSSDDDLDDDDEGGDPSMTAAERRAARIEAEDRRRRYRHLQPPKPSGEREGEGEGEEEEKGETDKKKKKKKKKDAEEASETRTRNAEKITAAQMALQNPSSLPLTSSPLTSSDVLAATNPPPGKLTLTAANPPRGHLPSHIFHPISKHGVGTGGGAGPGKIAPKIGTRASHDVGVRSQRRERRMERKAKMRMAELIEIGILEMREGRPPIPGAKRAYPAPVPAPAPAAALALALAPSNSNGPVTRVSEVAVVRNDGGKERADVRREVTMVVDTSPPGPESAAAKYRRKPILVPIGRHRQYGIPSIRTDVPPPRARSLGDHQNYGDELDAKSLVNPNPYIFRNIDVLEENLHRLRIAEARRMNIVGV